MPFQPTNIETLGTAIFARLDAQDALREAAFKSLTAEMHDINVQFARMEERFDAHKKRIDEKFEEMEKDQNAALEKKRSAGAERNNWVRTVLTLIGGAGIFKFLGSFSDWFGGSK